MLTKIKHKVFLLLFLGLFTSFSNGQSPPEALYYRFKNNSNNSTQNFAVPGLGNRIAPVLGHHIRPGGQFDSCLTGVTGTNNYVNTGWATNIGTGDWTISFWVSNLQNSNPTYLFGDETANNFRCFYGGAAGNNNLLLRGNFSDVQINNVMPGPTVIHIVYNGSSIKIYKNGVFQNSYPRSGINLSGTGPFEVGGTHSHNCMNQGGLMDEFRFYTRALTAAEILVTWDIELGIFTGIDPIKSVPDKFELSQNYPNPFNPSTIIKYGIPEKAWVKLTVYDETGKEAAILINDVIPAGNYEVTFDGSTLSSGMYLYKLETRDFIKTKRTILLK